MGASIGDRVVTLSSIIGAVRGNVANRLVSRDLAQQIGQNRRIADLTPCDLHSPHLQGLLVYPEMDLAPDAPFRAAKLAGAPLAFTLDL